MRTQITALVAAGAAAAVFAGCAPGANEELRALVDDVAPAEGEIVECTWGTNWGSESGSHYGCFYVVRGTLRPVAKAVLTRVAARGFTVTCRVGTSSCSAKSGLSSDFPRQTEPRVPYSLPVAA